jgi:hypothetical protein
MERSAGSNVTRTLRIVVLLVAAPLLLGAICAGGDDNSLPELEPFTLEQEQLLHDIRDVAADVRGLDVNLEAVEGTLSQEALAAYFDEQYAKFDEDDIAEFDAFSVALRLLHLIGPDDDYYDLVTSDDGGNILGLYQRDGDRLVLIGDSGVEIDPGDEMTLAHEYVHSFQDGTHDLERLYQYVANDDGDSRTEYGTTISCLIEGDATNSMFLYMEEVYGEEWRDVAFADDVEDEEPTEEENADYPIALSRYGAFNYFECYFFVAALYEDGGLAAVDEAYHNPPSTTEQVLHLDKYQKAEAARSPAPASIEDTLGEDWTLFDLSPFGEFDVFNYVASVLENDFLAAQAAAGWGSGWTSLYVQDQEDLVGDPPVLVHLQLDWDTTGDFLEFVGIYGEVIEVVSDGKWEVDEAKSTLLNRIDIVISSEQQPRDDVTAAQVLRP